MLMWSCDPSLRRSRGWLCSSERRSWSWRLSGASRTTRRTRRSRGCAPPWRTGSGPRPPEPSSAHPWRRRPTSGAASSEQRWRCARSWWPGWRKRRRGETKWRSWFSSRTLRRCVKDVFLYTRGFMWRPVQRTFNCNSVLWRALL